MSSPGFGGLECITPERFQMDAETWTRAEAAFPLVMSEGVAGAVRALDAITRSEPDVGECLRPAVDAYVSHAWASTAQAAEPRRDSTPEQVGRYVILGKIGEGGMGAVYCAHDSEIGRTVALKILRGHDDRFLDEVKAAGTLRHPNIITIYDCARIDGQSVIVMEHIEGQTVHDLIRRRRLGPLQTRLHLLRQLCEAMDYAHDCGIVHRDIKPSNLIVDRSGQLKVLDFGLARIGEPACRTADEIVGTLRYMSPEQMRGLEVDRRSDIFAVGIVAYEMLSYRHPFDYASAVRLAYAIRHETPTPLNQLVPMLDPGLWQIVSKALEKNPRDRYTTLSAALADLTRPAQGLSRTTSPDERSLRSASRRPGAERGRSALLSPLTWLALVLPVVAAVAIAAVMLKPAAPQTSARSPNPDATSGSPSAATAGWIRGTRLIGGGSLTGLTQGIHLLDQSCSDGETRACRDLASVFDAGTVVARDVPRAVSLYRRGCEGGDVRSCVRLAALYRGSTDIPADLPAAADASSRACALGSFAECNNAGVAYLEGIGVARSAIKGASLIARACENDVAVACINLARHLLGATASERDPARAFALLERSCELGYAAGCADAAAMLAAGRDMGRNEDRANRLWQRACDGNVRAACESLARRYRAGVGARRDLGRAAELDRRARQLPRSPEAQAGRAGLLMAGADSSD